MGGKTGEDREAAAREATSPGEDGHKRTGLRDSGREEQILFGEFERRSELERAPGVLSQGKSANPFSKRWNSVYLNELSSGHNSGGRSVSDDGAGHPAARLGNSAGALRDNDRRVGTLHDTVERRPVLRKRQPSYGENPTNARRSNPLGQSSLLQGELPEKRHRSAES